MRLFPCNIILGVTLLVVASCSPANAYSYSEADDAPQQSGRQADQSGSSPQRNSTFSSTSGTGEVSNGNMTIVRPSDHRKAFAPAPADMKLIGYWVGNMQYKVGQSADGLFVVNSSGMASPLPGGTQVDTIAIPFNNPFVQGILHAQPVASQETQQRSDKNGGMGRYISTPGMLKPTFMATRTLIVNGKAMVVGGPVICEYSPNKSPDTPAAQAASRTQHTLARIIKDTRHTVTTRTAKKKTIKKTSR